MPSGLSHLVMVVVRVARVLGFSTALFGRLSALQLRERQKDCAADGP
jgi:hypothetical protein